MRYRWAIFAALFFAILLRASWALTQQAAAPVPPPPAQLKFSAEQEMRLAEADVLFAEAERSFKEGKYRAGVPLAKQSLAIRAELLGERQLPTAASANQVGALLHMLGEYQQARPYVEQGLRVRQELLGDDHRYTAISLSNVGNALRALGEYQEGRRCLEQAVAIYIKIYGEKHSTTAKGLDNLGRLLQQQGDHASARLSYERALVIHRETQSQTSSTVIAELTTLDGIYLELEDYAALRKNRQELLAIRTKLDGAEHWRTIDARLALSDVDLLEKLTPDERQQLAAAEKRMSEAQRLHQQHRYADAIPLTQEAETIRRSILGEWHRLTSDSLNLLGLFHKYRGDYAQALPLYQQALAIRQQTLGRNHPHTATSLENLAHWHKAQKKYADALPLYRQTLAIRQQSHGGRDAATLTALDNLASLLFSMRDYAASREIYEQAVSVRRQLPGTDRLDLANSLHTLGIVRYLLGEHASAKTDQEEALAIRRSLLGDKHVDTAATLFNLGHVHSALGDRVAARNCYAEALAIRQELLGEQHADTIAAMEFLALVLRSLSDHPAARQFQEQALVARRATSGNLHPDTAWVLHSLGTTHYLLGDFEAARRCAEEALAIRRKALGEQHLDTARTWDSLASTYLRLGDKAAARKCLEEALSIRRKALGEQHPETLALSKRLTELFAGNANLAETAAKPEQHTGPPKSETTSPANQPSVASAAPTAGSSNRDELLATAQRLETEKKLPEAIAAVKQALVLDRATHGAEHSSVAETLEYLAWLSIQREDFAAARSAAEERLAICAKLHGPEHWRTTEARADLADANRWARFTPEERRQLANAEQLAHETDELEQQGQRAEAIRLAEEATKIQQSIWGESHPSVGACLNRLAILHLAAKEYDQSLSCFQRALANLEQTRGSEHPDAIIVLGNLASLRKSQGNDSEAARLYRQAMTNSEKSLGPEDSQTVAYVQRLASLHKSQRNYAEAIPLYARALEAHRQSHGVDSSEAISDLDALDQMYSQQEDFAALRKIRAELLAIRARRDGEKHWRTIDARLSLADVDLWEKLTPDQRRQLTEADRQTNESEDLHDKRQYVEAVRLAQQAATTRQSILGNEHRTLADSLNRQALSEKYQGHYATAEPLYRQTLAIREKILGSEHPDTGSTLNNLGALLFSRKEYAESLPFLQRALKVRESTLGNQSPSTRITRNSVANAYFYMKDYAAARPYYEQVLADHKDIVSPNSVELIPDLEMLDRLYRSQEDFAALRTARAGILAIRAKSDGPEHWRAVDARLALADVDVLEKLTSDDRERLASADRWMSEASRLKKKRQYTEAIALVRQAADVRQSILGEAHRMSADCEQWLGTLSHAVGEEGNALRHYRLALNAFEKTLGPSHPWVATSQLTLANLYQDVVGDYSSALPLKRRALAIREQVFGPEDPLTADALDSLYSLLTYRFPENQGIDRKPLLTRALAIREKAYGSVHPDVADSLSSLALEHCYRNEYASALPLYQRSLAIQEKALGADHSAVDSCLIQIAFVYDQLGYNAAALPLLERALAIAEATSGPDSYATADILGSLAWHYRSQGQDIAALPLYDRWVKIQLRRVQLTADAQSEREQLLMNRRFRNGLDAYLTTVMVAHASAADAAEHVLAAKGAVLIRQRQMRLARTARESNPALAGILDELQDVTRRLATLALAAPQGEQLEARQQQLAELSRRKEELEGELSHRSADFRRQQSLAPSTPRHVVKALPPDAALVDFSEYRHSAPQLDEQGQRKFSSSSTRRLAAIVLRPDCAPQLIDLGSVEPIQSAVDAWRETFGATTATSDPGVELKKLVWQPLEEHLAGAKTVFLSPDGPLTRFPFAALPGSKPGTYLLEDVALAVVPVPQLLPELLAPHDGADQREPSLLVVGDVDYGAMSGAAPLLASSRAAPRGESLGSWPALTGTAQEALGVSESFQRGLPAFKLETLQKDRATEQAFRQEAPNHRFLHVATHGFFAPPQLRSALSAVNENDAAAPGTPEFRAKHDLAGYHPGLLSGLVLAGANRPVATNLDDGILTALEVAELDLSGVEIAVLSACETGLGETAGGEGLLGLQRAFQVAGCRNVVASLWKVDDQATAALMRLFYYKLWIEKKPPIEALREAQLALLRHPEQIEQLATTRSPNFGATVKLVDGGRANPASATASNVRHWAAFVLSGPGN